MGYLPSKYECPHFKTLGGDTFWKKKIEKSILYGFWPIDLDLWEIGQSHIWQTCSTYSRPSPYKIWIDSIERFLQYIHFAYIRYHQTDVTTRVTIAKTIRNWSRHAAYEMLQMRSSFITASMILLLQRSTWMGCLDYISAKSDSFSAVARQPEGARGCLSGRI